MDRYLRRTLGLVALFALVVSMAHTVWALCCMVDSGSLAAVSVAPEDGSAQVHLAMHPASRQHTTINAGHTPINWSQQDSHQGPFPHAPLHECPHGQAGVLGGCVVAAAIPPAAAVVAAVPFGDHNIVIVPDILPRILFGTDLFRPPRA